MVSRRRNLRRTNSLARARASSLRRQIHLSSTSLARMEKDNWDRDSRIHRWRFVRKLRMRQLVITFSLLIAATVCAGDTSQICITFDDLPVVRASTAESAKALTVKMLRAIRAEKIPAIGFVNENKLERDGKVDHAMVELLRLWNGAGLELGNHTYSHMDLHRTSLEAFKQDVIRGENITREILKDKANEARYFRHPYLHTGTDQETKRKLEQFIASRGYTVAPVTIDNSEWIFALAYDKAGGDQDLKQRIADSYITYMRDKITYYENQSRMLTGRNVRQILLLHANQLNADFLPALLDMIRQKGYTFISIGEALQDEAYKLPDSFMGQAGISWIHRWAITRGVNKDFFTGEPLTPPFVLEVAGITEE